MEHDLKVLEIAQGASRLNANKCYDHSDYFDYPETDSSVRVWLI